MRSSALIIRGVEPEQLLENARRVLEALDPPETQSIPVQASKIGSIVEQVPGEHAIELLAERPAAEFHPRGEVGECLCSRSWSKAKCPRCAWASMQRGSRSAICSSSRRAAKNWPLSCSSTASRIGSVSGSSGSSPGQDLLHLEQWPGLADDDRRHPLLAGGIAPGMGGRIPGAAITHLQRGQPREPSGSAGVKREGHGVNLG